MPDPGPSCISYPYKLGFSETLFLRDDCIWSKTPRTRAPDWRVSNYITGGNMGASSQANEVKGFTCNGRPAQTSIVQRCERPQHTQTSPSLLPPSLFSLLHALTQGRKFKQMYNRGHPRANKDRGGVRQDKWLQLLPCCQSYHIFKE